MAEHQPKRRKVSLACVECREKKRKCDGVRPFCGGCARRASRPACIYTDETLKRGSSSYVETLRARIRELEETVAHSESPAGPPSPPVSETVRNSQTTSEQELTSVDLAGSLQSDHRNTGIALWPSGPSSLDAASSSTHMSFAPSMGNKTLFTSNQSQNDSDGRPSLDFLEDPASQDSAEEDGECVGIGVMGTLSGSLCQVCKGLRGQRSDYSGPSSVVDFDRQIRYWTVSPVLDTNGPSSEEGAAPNLCYCPTTQATMPPLVETEFSIPRRATADTLVESYFDRVHSLYPFLHRPTFMQSYLQLWQPVPPQKDRKLRATDSRGFHCLLNAVFALGSRFSPHLDATARISTSEVFYNRVIASLNFQLVERGSLEYIQTLLLTAQYLQSTQIWGMCWNLVGLAVRVAQGIGLHLNPSDSAKNLVGQPSSLLAEEMRRRVWGGCVTLDRVLAMVYGRPQMLHPSSTRSFIHNLPSKTDDELTGLQEDSTDSRRPRMIEFFVQSLKLIHYLGDILDSLHGQDSKQAASCEGNEDPEDGLRSIGTAQFQRMLRLDATLVNWRKQLPPHLQTQYGELNSIFWRQSQALRARYLHMRMFLLRPVLLALHQYGQDPGSGAGVDDSVEHRVEFDRLIRVSKMCLVVTRALIDLIYRDVHNGPTFSIVWWYGVYYINTCATVVHTARLCLSLNDSEDVKTLQDSFNDCLQCLTKYEIYGLPAKRCKVALQMLEKRAFPVRRSMAGDICGSRDQLMSYLNEPSNTQQSDIDLLLSDPFSTALFNSIEDGTLGMDTDGLFPMTLMPSGESCWG